MTKTVGSTLLALTIGIPLALTGCKGETKEVDRPETLTKLQLCETNLKAKVEYANSLNDRIDTLEKAGPTTPPISDDAIVVTLEGELMTITSGKGKGPNGPKDPKGNAKDEELYAAFIKQVKRSRGSIKKCYQAALKKDNRLSTKTISLNIGVNYKTSGKVKSASFSPNVSAQFNSCMKGVATKWGIPAMPRTVTFNYKQTLTPE